MVQNIKKDRSKLKNVLTNGVLPIEDVVLFCDKLDDITGQNMQSFYQFMAKNYMKDKDKRAVNWNELYKILIQEWPVYESDYRNSEKVDEWMGDDNEAEIYDDNFVDEYGHRIFEDDVQIEIDGYKDKGRYLMKMKLEKHLEKITDVFKAYSYNMPRSDSESDDFTTTKRSSSQTKTKGQTTKQDFLSRTERQESLKKDESKSEVDTKTENDGKTDADKTENEDATSESKSHTTRKTVDQKDSIITLHKNVEDLDMQVPLVKVSKLSKVLRDLGYLCGIYFITREEYHEGSYNPKKTNKSIIDKILRHCWKQIHISDCIEKVQRGSAKSQGASILKNAKDASGNFAKSMAATSRQDSSISDTQTKKDETQLNETGKDETQLNETGKDETQRPETQQSNDSASSDKTKKTTKTEQTDGVSKTENKTSNDSGDDSDDKTSKTK